MEKLTLCALVLGFILTTSCEKEEQSFDEAKLVFAEEVLASKRKCYDNDMLEKQLKDDPMMAKWMPDIEMQTKSFSSSGMKVINGTVTIPVIVCYLQSNSAKYK